MARFCLIIEDDESDGSTAWRCKMSPLPEADAKHEDLSDTQICGIAIMNYIKDDLLADQDIEDMALTDFDDDF